MGLNFIGKRENVVNLKRESHYLEKGTKCKLERARYEEWGELGMKKEEKWITNERKWHFEKIKRGKSISTGFFYLLFSFYKEGYSSNLNSIGGLLAKSLFN